MLDAHPLRRPGAPSRSVITRADGARDAHRGGSSRDRAPASLTALFFLGATAILARSYWDDAWHTEQGRVMYAVAALLLFSIVRLTRHAAAGWGDARSGSTASA